MLESRDVGIIARNLTFDTDLNLLSINYEESDPLHV